jgi:DNA-directed RNA polymerase specialized sigma subunit
MQKWQRNENNLRVYYSPEIIEIEIDEIEEYYDNLNSFERYLIKLRFEKKVTFKQISVMTGISKYKLSRRYEKIYYILALVVLQCIIYI